jgi:hypothetical protein
MQDPGRMMTPVEDRAAREPANRPDPAPRGLMMAN